MVDIKNAFIQVQETRHGEKNKTIMITVVYT